MDGLNRNLSRNIKRLLDSFPVVVILGVRQCGKSTLSRMLGPGWKYYDLESPTDYDRVENDPVLFFKDSPQQIIIDEAQTLSSLFSTLRGVIDEDRNKNGRFILIGSASFELLKNISESLAGRVAIVELSSLKMNEIRSESMGTFFDIFEKKIDKGDLDALKKLRPARTYVDVKHHLLKGGYPQPLLKKDDEFHLDWMENYFSTYINRDMRALFPRIDILKYRRVVKMLSSLSGSIINKSEISRSVECSEKLIRDYLQIISGTFFWRELPGFRTSKIKNTTSSPKGHYRDSGLMFFLQNVFTLNQMDVYPKLGNAFEGFVVEEIIRGIDATKAKNTSFSHYRTKAGAEIDLVVEGSFGLLPVEIKYGSNTTKKQLLGMINFIEKLDLPYGIVVNNCDEPSLIAEKIIQIPAGCL